MLLNRHSRRSHYPTGRPKNPFHYAVANDDLLLYRDNLHACKIPNLAIREVNSRENGVVHVYPQVNTQRTLVAHG